MSVIRLHAQQQLSPHSLPPSYLPTTAPLFALFLGLGLSSMSASTSSLAAALLRLVPARPPVFVPLAGAAVEVLAYGVRQ